MYSPGNSVIVNSFLRWPVVTTVVACCVAAAPVVVPQSPPDPVPVVVTAPVVEQPTVEVEPDVTKCGHGLKPHVVDGKTRCVRG